MPNVIMLNVISFFSMPRLDFQGLREAGMGKDDKTLLIIKFAMVTEII